MTTMTPELRADLRALLDYDWSAEERDFDENPDDRHIFRAMTRLDAFLSVESSPWGNDLVQFSRLLAEIVATQSLDVPALCEAMGLEPADVDELLERAHVCWEHAKSVLTLTSLQRGDADLHHLDGSHRSTPKDDRAKRGSLVEGSERSEDPEPDADHEQTVATFEGILADGTSARWALSDDDPRVDEAMTALEAVLGPPDTLKA